MILQLFHLSYLDLFQDVNLTIQNNGLFLLQGKSGSGKTTFLHILSNLIKDYQGEVLIDHYSYKNHHRKLPFSIGVMFQNEYLIHEYTLMQQLLLYGFSKEKIVEMLERLDLYELKNQLIGKLSLGQLQRASLALVALSSPPIILLDEPTSQLDLESIQKCKEVILELAKSSMVIVATHQKDEYISEANGILTIENKTITYTNIQYPLRFAPIGKNRPIEGIHLLKLSLLHMKSYLFTHIKLIISFLFVFTFLLIGTVIYYDFNDFLTSYSNRFGDLNTLYIDEVDQEILLQFPYSHLSHQSSLLLDLEVDILSNQVDLKEGRMPGRNEIIVSEDLGGDQLNLFDQSYEIVGVVDNPFLKRVVYMNSFDYEGLLKGEGSVMSFNSFEEMKEAKNRLEKEYYIQSTNHYLEFVDHYSSIQSLVMRYFYIICIYSMIFILIWIILTIRPYLDQLKHEMVLLKLAGLSKLKMISFYCLEIERMILIGLSIAILLGYKLVQLLNQYFPIYFFEMNFHFNQLISKERLLLSSISILLVNGCLILVYLLFILYSTSQSVSQLVKENEGC